MSCNSVQTNCLSVAKCCFPVHNYVHNGPNSLKTNCILRAISSWVKHTQHEATSSVQSEVAVFCVHTPCVCSANRMFLPYELYIQTKPLNIYSQYTKTAAVLSVVTTRNNFIQNLQRQLHHSYLRWSVCCMLLAWHMWSGQPIFQQGIYLFILFIYFNKTLEVLHSCGFIW